MRSFLVLLQPLITNVLLTTNQTLKLLTMNTGSCMSCMHPFIGKNLPTLTTWEFLTPVDPHMDHKVVVGLEGLLAHRTVLSLPGYRWNLVGDLSNLPSLSTLRKVFPTKKGGHLLLYLFQHPLLDQYLILSRTDLGRNLCRSRSLHRGRTPKHVSGYPRFSFQTSSLILAGQPNRWILLSV